ncbi:MAG: sulfatase [Opitutales bacterium]|nr:sulfatase [Opitutales bacterium]
MSPRPLNLFAISILVFAASVSAFGRQSSESGKPNVVLILVDDLGVMDLGVYGSTFYETPRLDQLAAESVRFTDAYATASICSPTRASLMTGKHPAELKITDWLPGRDSHAEHRAYMRIVAPEIEESLPLEEVTIAEALKEHGYATGFFGKWHIGEDEAHWPEHQGFDINIGGWKKGVPYYRQYDGETDTWSGESGFFSPYKNPRLEDGPEGESLTERLTDETIQFIEDKKDEPFFAFLSFYTVHNPMHAKEEYVEYFRRKARVLGLDRVPHSIKSDPDERVGKGRWIERLVQSHPKYAAMVYSMDFNVGRVLDALKENGLEENTIVIFTSDNGGLSTSEGSPTSNLPYNKGKGWLNEGGIREPFIIGWMGHLPQGKVLNVPVTVADVFPTILDLANLPLSPELHNYGESLEPLMRGEDTTLGERSLHWHYPHHSNQGGLPSGAIRKGNYKLIEYFYDGSVELFNLKNDVSEVVDLSEKKPELAKELLSELRTWRESVEADMPKENPDYNGL